MDRHSLSFGKASGSGTEGAGQGARRGGGIIAALAGFAGLIATGTALAAGAILAVFTAMAVAVFALIAGVAVFFTGIALKARRRHRTRNAPAGEGVIEAQKINGTWVAYGWDRQSR